MATVGRNNNGTRIITRKGIFESQAAYDAIAFAKSNQSFDSIIDLISNNYNNNISDEFFYPACNEKYPGIQTGDVVVFCKI